jgi:hypothetical protein
MTALAADRATKRAGNQAKIVNQRVELGTDIVYAGGMVGRLSTGLCVAGAATAGMRILGVACETVDNAAGDSGVYANIMRGAFWFANSESADEILDDHLGEKCYVVDDNVVAATIGAAGARPVAGRVIAIDSTDGVLVEICGDEEGAIASGTFTPTITTGTNTTASSVPVGWYTRVGNLVTFTIRASLTHTAGAPTASTFDASLPIASAFDAAADAGGVITGTAISLGAITANTTDDRLTFSYSNTGTGALVVQGSGHYLIK